MNHIPVAWRCPLSPCVLSHFVRLRARLEAEQLARWRRLTWRWIVWLSTRRCWRALRSPDSSSDTDLIRLKMSCRSLPVEVSSMSDIQRYNYSLNELIHSISQYHFPAAKVSKTTACGHSKFKQLKDRWNRNVCSWCRNESMGDAVTTVHLRFLRQQPERLGCRWFIVFILQFERQCNSARCAQSHLKVKMHSAYTVLYTVYTTDHCTSNGVN